MPTISVKERNLLSTLGIDADIEAFEELCFDFGLECDGRDPETEELRLEIPANRYDLLCQEGLEDALRAFLKPETTSFAEYRSTECRTQMMVDPAVRDIRPYAVAAIYRDVDLDEESFLRFIDLQDKLHQNLCRKRTLLAIGTHNLDVLKPPYLFTALPKKGGFHFVPLNHTEEVDGERMMVLLQDTYLKPYLHIVQDIDVLPVIFDANKTVLSVPPIINGDHSKMSSTTRNIFVEVTGTDIRKAEIVLDVITAFLGRKTKTPLTVEPVELVYMDGHPGIPVRDRTSQRIDNLRRKVHPSLESTFFTVHMDYVRKLIGLESITVQEIMNHLPRMMMRGKIVDSSTVRVEVPITRRDVLHACDIVEDIAISIGYNNIKRQVQTSVSLQPINNLSERVRRHLAMSGWRECLTFGLVSLADCFDNLRRTNEKSEHNLSYRPPAMVSDPKTKEFECLRTNLMSGLLKTVSSNQHAELPIQIFEIGDCGYVEEGTENRMKHERHIAALIASNRSGLEEIHGLMDSLLMFLDLQPEYGTEASWRAKKTYKLVPVLDKAFLDGRCVSVEIAEDGTCIGVMGVVHPEVMQHYGMSFACALFEVVLDPIMGWVTEDETAIAAP